jgi:hypothetical protein
MFGSKAGWWRTARRIAVPLVAHNQFEAEVISDAAENEHNSTAYFICDQMMFIGYEQARIWMNTLIDHLLLYWSHDVMSSWLRRLFSNCAPSTGRRQHPPPLNRVGIVRFASFVETISISCYSLKVISGVSVEFISTTTAPWGGWWFWDFDRWMLDWLCSSPSLLDILTLVF